MGGCRIFLWCLGGQLLWNVACPGRGHGNTALPPFLPKGHPVQPAFKSLTAEHLSIARSLGTYWQKDTRCPVGLQVREVKGLEKKEREIDRKEESCRVDETQRKEVKTAITCGEKEELSIVRERERVRVKGNQLACLHARRKTCVYMFGIKLCWKFPVHTHKDQPYMVNCSN